MIYKKNNDIIGIIGLGYVGLPLAIELSKYYEIVGFDIKKSRIKELSNNYDENNQFTKNDLNDAKINCTNSSTELKKCNIFIITVPTPILASKQPDLKPLKNSSKLVGRFLKKGSIVIYESTVFPGCTEEVCVPILSKISGLIYNKDFFCGYSPERINFGDDRHTLTNIKKIVSGSNESTSAHVDKIYSRIIKAGTYKTKSIIVAEAAKVIENTQRDLNIALTNEFSMIFNKLNIKSSEVFEAASTKWNFLKFHPGLVGGHCIGVDPYYLTYKANKIGHYPKLILSGRNINDQMPKYVFNEINKIFLKSSDNKKKNILIMGISFKNNIPDYRNSQAIKLYKLFKKFNNVDIYDPIVNRNKIFLDEKIKLIKEVKKNFYDSIIIAVNHNKIKKIGLKKIISYGKKRVLLFDILDLFNSKLNKWCL